MLLEPMRRVLVVGAGFAGAVHARVLAEAGIQVQVIDQRGHIAGNAYDCLDDRGVRVHQYGPHLFHTNNEGVVRWLANFGEFVPYEHRVAAQVGGRLVSFPVNRLTFEQFFNRSFASEAELEAFIATIVEDIPEPRNAAEFLASRIGREMTDLFFRPYTLKMWSLDLEDLDSSVVRRIPIRMDRDDRYFPNDKFQMLPRHGYTRIFENIFDHEKISVNLNVAFDKSMERDYDAVFLSSPIDDYFDCRFGKLPYRSIRFHHAQSKVDETPVATINYTDASPFTRETHWQKLPLHAPAAGLISTKTVEEPCDYKDNKLERYYPVKDASGSFRARYEQYAELAKTLPRVRFIGRCGTYTYLDMHQVINQSLISANGALAPGLRQSLPGREAALSGQPG